MCVALKLVTSSLPRLILGKEKISLGTYMLISVWWRLYTYKLQLIPKLPWFRNHVNSRQHFLLHYLQKQKALLFVSSPFFHPGGSFSLLNRLNSWTTKKLSHAHLRFLNYFTKQTTKSSNNHQNQFKLFKYNN